VTNHLGRFINAAAVAVKYFTLARRWRRD
jgi:hypothetical protein